MEERRLDEGEPPGSQCERCISQVAHRKEDLVTRGAQVLGDRRESREMPEVRAQLPGDENPAHAFLPRWGWVTSPAPPRAPPSVSARTGIREPSAGRCESPRSPAFPARGAG